MTHDRQTSAGNQKMRVLLVAGTGRSGSTIVSNLLGSVPGLVSVGELRYLWERGLGESGVCGCGAPVPECPFWTRVLASAYPQEPAEVQPVRRADNELLRVRRLPAVLLAKGHAQRLGDVAVWYTQELERVLRALNEVTGGAVLVDSSKLATYGYLLAQLADVELTVLHLVRDPRGVAYSWSKDRVRADRGGNERMGREGVLRSSLLWDLWNLLIEVLWHGGTCLRVRYEDVVDDPRRALGKVLDEYGFSGASLPVLPDGTVELARSHTVAGNPARMASGRVPLVADTEWITALARWRKVVVTTLTAPLLHHYGYAVWPTSGSAPPPRRVFVEDMHGVRRTGARVRRNVAWVRGEGVRRVLEEKEVDPLRTAPAAVRKWAFRHSRGNAAVVEPGHAVPVFVVGVQRSGTNMLVRGIGMAPQVEVHNENDRRAFDTYKLRPLPVIRAIVAASRHSHVLFKPLCDSHRTDELLDGLRTAAPPLAVWVYRDVDARVRSALAKFGDGNLQVLREFASGANTDRWHVQRISQDSAELVRSFDYDRLSAASGAALVWLIRNRLFFEHRLDSRRDVHLASYDEFLSDPAGRMRRLCEFLRFPYDDALVRHVAARPPTHLAPLDIDPRIRRACDELTERLEDALSPASPAKG